MAKRTYYDLLSIKTQTMRTSVKDVDIKREYEKNGKNVDKTVEAIKRKY